MDNVFFTHERDAVAVEEQPVLLADSWRVFETEAGQLHLSLYLGHAVARLTSAIEVVDLHARTLVTASGRRYVLGDAPECDEMKVTAIWTNAVRVLGDVADVSNDLWGQVLATAH
jgi:hypothetical protein